MSYNRLQSGEIVSSVGRTCVETPLLSLPPSPSPLPHLVRSPPLEQPRAVCEPPPCVLRALAQPCAPREGVRGLEETCGQVHQPHALHW